MFSACVSLALFAAAGLSFFFGGLFPEQAHLYIYMAAGLAALTIGTRLLQQITDACALTVGAEILRMFQSLIGLGFLGGLFLAGKLSLFWFFIYNHALLLALGIGFALIIIKNGVYKGENWSLKKAEALKLAGDFYRYCHPIAVYTAAGAAVNYLDRWMLQIFGGSVQQGFFGLSSQIGAICLIFTSAMTPLVMREFSMNHESGDSEKTARLFKRQIPMLYAVSAYFAAFVSIEAGRASLIFGGERFAEASAAVMIMALYPAHQTCGQLSGSYFLAAGKTALYRNIGVAVLLLGLPASYLAVAPPSMMGFGGGALGLALKTVILNIISVNILIYFICRMIKMRFVYFPAHQALCLGGFALLALGAKHFSAILTGSAVPPLWGFIASGVVYTVLSAAAVAVFPHIAGFTRNELMSETASIAKRLRSIYGK